MKLHLLNDIHLKHARCAPAPVQADALVLAGDIADGGDPALVLELARLYREAGLPVLYVPGNHEYYGTRMHVALLKMWRAFRKAGVELLHDRYVDIEGVRFFGATLWTDYLLLGPEKLADSVGLARHFMADHTWIFVADPKYPRGVRAFDPLDAKKLHERSLRRMRAAFDGFDGKRVVVSHHGPSPRSIHPKYAGHGANPAFVSNLEPLMQELAVDLWMHGHVHNSFDYRVGATRVVANPRGYPLGRLVGQQELVFENHEFNFSKVIRL